jgi:type I restriction enzyme, S subunit
MAVKEGYKRTDAGVIPEDWRLAKISDLTTIIGDGIHATPNYIDRSGYYFINGNNLSDGDIVYFEGTKQVSFEEYNKHMKNLNDRTILMSINGTIGNLAYYKKELVILGKSVCYINVEKSTIKAFIYYQLQNKYVGIFYDNELTGTTIKNLSLNSVRNTPIILPKNQEEQKAIATALSDIDGLIDSLSKLIEKKKKIKQGAMQELLTGKKRLEGFSGEWLEFKVEDISIVSRGRVISHIEISKSFTKKYPVYSSQTINDGIMGFLDTYDFEGDYITWTTDGVNAGTVFYRKGRFNCTNVCGTIKLKTGNYYFIAKRLGLETNKHVSRNLANPKLMNDVMKKVVITLPPTIEEQTAIATILSGMDSEIEKIQAKLDKYKAVKQGMMQELLTGRIRLLEGA